jgi:pre-mRNA-splicing factor SYF1
MKIYDRALKDIENKDNKFEIFNLYLAKASQYFGVTHSRQLFERAF